MEEDDYWPLPPPPPRRKEMTETLGRLKKGRIPGYDKLQTELLQYASKRIIKTLHD